MDTICPSLASGLQGFEYKVDTSYEYYLNNWYVDMNLECENPIKTNSMVTANFILSGVAGLAFSTIPDKYGRKKATIVFLGLLLAAQIATIIWPSYLVRFFFFTMNGLCVLKVTVPYVWASELVDTHQISFVNCVISTFDMTTIAFICFYYQFISRECQPLIIVTTVIGVISYIVSCLALPESPKLLIA
jgi:MFS family permease